MCISRRRKLTESKADTLAIEKCDWVRAVHLGGDYLNVYRRTPTASLPHRRAKIFTRLRFIPSFLLEQTLRDFLLSVNLSGPESDFENPANYLPHLAQFPRLSLRSRHFARSEFVFLFHAAGSIWDADEIQTNRLTEYFCTRRGWQRRCLLNSKDQRVLPSRGTITAR